MTDLERIARAIWADRAARILAEDIAGKTEEGSAGKMTYDELGEKFRAGLMSEARAAITEARELTDYLFRGMFDAILNSENAA